MNIDRRAFLASAAAFAAVGGVRADGAAANRKIRLAAQMYSVRGIANDRNGFLAMVKLMKNFGYSGIEFAGTWVGGKELKKYLDDLGLACAGAHVGLGSCLKANMVKTCEENLAIGNTALVMPWAQPPKDCTDLKGWWKRLGNDLSEGAEVAKKHGCTLAYHNHGHEFVQKIDGVSLWNLIMGDASEALKIQFDVGHLAHAGESAAPWFGRYAERIVSIHAKGVCGENARLKPAAGQRGVDWPEMFDLTRKSAVGWYIVEEEGNPCDTQKMKRGADFLRKNAPFLG